MTRTQHWDSAAAPPPQPIAEMPKATASREPAPRGISAETRTVSLPRAGERVVWDEV